jgi:hypothetical protein
VHRTRKGLNPNTVLQHFPTCIIKVAMQVLELGWNSSFIAVISLPAGRRAKLHPGSIPSGNILVDISVTQRRDGFWSPHIFLSTECRCPSSRDEAADQSPTFNSEIKNAWNRTSTFPHATQKDNFILWYL